MPYWTLFHILHTRCGGPGKRLPKVPLAKLQEIVGYDNSNQIRHNYGVHPSTWCPTLFWMHSCRSGGGCGETRRKTKPKFHPLRGFWMAHHTNQAKTVSEEKWGTCNRCLRVHRTGPSLSLFLSAVQCSSQNRNHSWIQPWYGTETRKTDKIWQRSPKKGNGFLISGV